MSRRLQRHLDTIVAALIFVAAAAVSAYAYTNVVKSERPEFVLADGIRTGNSTKYLIHQGKCIGEFTHQLDRGENSHLRSTASIHTSYGKLRTIATVKLALDFNPLGQLFNGSAELSARDTKIFVKLREINPVRINAQVSAATKLLQYNLAAPGPVHLKRASDETFQIEYSAVRNQDLSYVQGLSSGLLGGIDISVQDAESSAVSCEPEDRSFYDISGFVLRARMAEGLLERFMPNALP
jgi:hypothetical protein